MATLNITIPDTQLTRVLNAVCDYNGYSATLPDGSPNPEIKFQFVKRLVIEKWKETVMMIEKRNKERAITVDISDLTIT